MEKEKNNINLLIFVFGLILFITKWYHAYVNFDEDIEAKIIFESVSDGYYNFVPLKGLANLNLNNSFSPFIENLGTVPIPFGAFIFHFISYLVLGNFSFIILELFFIIFFLIIFYKISRLFNLGRIQSLLVSVILINLPNILQFINLYNIQYFTVIFSEFYSLRFPRPLVSNILFFLFIFFILKSEKKNFFIKKNAIIFGTISGLLFSSYFHAFFLQQIFLIFYLIYKFRSKIIQIIKKNFDFVLIYILTFFFVSLPFLINYFFLDADLMGRSGFADIDFEKKLILLDHLFLKLLDFHFLFVLFISFLLLYFINKKNKSFNFEKLNLLLIIFYSSIIAPFIFVLISPNFSSHFYHFTNLVLISVFILFFYTIILFINYFVRKKLSVNLINKFSFILIFFLLIQNIYQSNNNYKMENLNNERFIQRTEFNTIINIIKKNNILDASDVSLLTFDERFLVWATLIDIKYLNIVNGVMVSRTNNTIENDLIGAFKYLDLSKNDLNEFIKNKKISDWRYRNDNVRKLFWMRYQANSLITYNDSKNFDKEILKFVNKSSPLLSQQLVMPNEEISRLILKFDSTKLLSFMTPALIIIDKRDAILKKSKIDKKKFCKAFEGKIYDFYYSNNLILNCEKN